MINSNVYFASQVTMTSSVKKKQGPCHGQDKKYNRKQIVRQEKGAYQGNPYVASPAVARWSSGTHYLCPSSPCKMLYGLPMSALVPFQRKEWTRWKRKALRKILSMSAVIQRVNKTTYTALSVKCLFLKQERLSPLVTRKSDCSTTT